MLVDDHERHEDEAPEAQPVERDAGDHERQRGRERPERHARRVGREAQHQELLARHDAREDGHRRQHQDLGHLADRHEPAADAEHLPDRVVEPRPLGDLGLHARDEAVGLHEVELVDHADRDRHQEEHEERLAHDLADRLEPRGVLLGALGGRRVRQREAVQAHQRAERGAHLERDAAAGVLHRGDLLRRRARGRVRPEQDLPDGDADGDPADGAPHAHRAEVLVAVREVGERERVGQRHRRRVDEPVHRRQREERVEVLGDAHRVDERRAHEVADAEDLLRGEGAVGQLPGDERPEDRADRARGEAVADLLAGELQVAAQVGVEDRQPGPPRGVLQEHHHGQAGSDVDGAGRGGRRGHGA